MSVTNDSPIFPQTVLNKVVQIANADGTTKKTLWAGSATGDKIECIIVTSNDTAARILNFYFTISAVDYPIGQVNVPITSGQDPAAAPVAIPAISVLETNALLPWVRKDSDGRGYLYVASGTTLKVAAQVAVTAAKEIDIVAIGGSY